MDMNMVIDIIFFLVIALFLILAARLIVERSEPKFVVVSITAPFSYILKFSNPFKACGKKGFTMPTNTVVWVVLVVVALAVSLVLIFTLRGNMGAGDMIGGLLDVLGLV